MVTEAVRKLSSLVGGGGGRWWRRRQGRSVILWLHLTPINSYSVRLEKVETEGVVRCYVTHRQES